MPVTSPDDSEYINTFPLNVGARRYCPFEAILINQELEWKLR